MKLIFKRGDTFSVPIRFEVNNVPIEITNDMEFSCDIMNVKCLIIDSAVVTPYVDQVTNKGFLLLTVADTSLWEIGFHKLDIKYVLNGITKHSQDLEFNVVRAVTV